MAQERGNLATVAHSLMIFCLDLCIVAALEDDRSCSYMSVRLPAETH